MRTLLIDNYDSYTFNLFHLLGEVNAEAPIVVRNDELPWDRLAALDADNIVISPGPGRPEHARDVGASLDALRHARVPVLGVCLGHQALAYVAGGSVEHAREVMHGRLSAIQHDEGALFAGIPQGFMAVRYHSLVVGAVPEDLRVTAWTPDGVVMALEHRSRPLYGVQFHPESVATHHGRRLIENFRDLTPGRARRPGPRAQWRAPGASRRARSTAPSMPGASPRPRSERLYSDHPHAVWLDSARVGRFSFIGAPDGPDGQVVRYDVNTGTTVVDRASGRETRSESVLDHCRRELARLRAHAPELPFDFQCGFAGYLGWELKAECGAERAHRSLAARRRPRALRPAARLRPPRARRPPARARRRAASARRARGWGNRAAAARPRPRARAAAARAAARAGSLRFEPHDDAATYLANIEAAKREILRGRDL